MVKAATSSFDLISNPAVRPAEKNDFARPKFEESDSFHSERTVAVGVDAVLLSRFIFCSYGLNRFAQFVPTLLAGRKTLRQRCPAGVTCSGFRCSHIVHHRFDLQIEFGQLAVIGRVAFCEPDKINAVATCVFQKSAGANSTHHAVEPQPGDDSRMNGRLSAFALVDILSLRPVQLSQRFIEQPDLMIFVDHIIERRSEHCPLLPDNHGFRPILGRRHPTPPLPAAVPAFLQQFSPAAAIERLPRVRAGFRG